MIYASLVDRIRSNSEITDPYSCWVWQRRKDRDGYGRMNIFVDGKHRTFRVMRVVFEQVRGPIPDGLVLDHLCRNRACVNPEHLEPVTVKINNERAHDALPTRCERHAIVKLKSGCIECRRTSWRNCARRIRAEKRLRQEAAK